MNTREIALELTLKALECNRLAEPVGNGKTNEEILSSMNEDSAVKVAKFYNTVLEAIDSAEPNK